MQSPTSHSILLVDDDQEFLEILMRRLIRRGMTVTGAGSPAEALHAAGQQQFQVAVIDRSLPGQDGLELMAGLKAGNSQLQVIVLSGHSDQASIDGALTNGAREYLTKPCGLSDLEDAINRALGITGAR